jgi:hypothetical protein
MSDLPYIVTAHGALTEDGFWVIDARLMWPQGPPRPGTTNRGEGLMALLKAIADERQRGRCLGASKVKVRLAGHDQFEPPINLVPGTDTAQ